MLPTMPHEREHRDQHHRPQQVELLLHRQRPGRVEQTQAAAAPAERLVDVREVRQDVGRALQRRGPIDVRSDRDHEQTAHDDEQQQRGQEPERAPNVEGEDVDPPGRIDLGDEQRRDEEPAQRRTRRRRR
jgi:hypothetical protein